MALERRLKLAAESGAILGVDAAIKVAFATGDMKQVDQHFGAAESLAIYALNPKQITLVEVVQFGQPAMGSFGSGNWGAGSLPDASGRNEGRLAVRIDALDGCIAVYCRAAGASAISQLRQKGVQAIKVGPGAEIRNLLEALQNELSAGPSAWLARAMSHREPSDARRFDHMEQEGWVE